MHSINFKTDIILQENENLITNQTEISDLFNNFFINVASDIGKDSVKVDANHPSIIEIQKMNREHFCEDFDFKPIPENFVVKQIVKLGIKKATGYDQISPKILKLANQAIEEPITMLINKSLETSVFPNSLKVAQVVPVHKKNSTLSKGNYRPVSVLPAISKFFERAVYIQITDFFG